MELWVEKYRPTTLDGYVGNEVIKNKIKDYLKQGSIQNLLLHGVAGTGKTTLAKLLVKNIDCDYLYINASDERGIDTIREKIQPFALSMGFNDVKIVILDEADYLTPQAQATLRHTIEACSATTRFILTCNYLERIISPLQSRCQTFEITPPSKTEVNNKCKSILSKEDISYENNDVLTVIDTHYPDIRKIINTLQGSVIDGGQRDYYLKIDNNSLKNTQLGGLVVDALIRKAKLSEIRQILADSGAREFDDLFKYIYNKSSVLFGDREGEAILIIAKYQYEYTFVLEKEICIAAMLNKLLDIC
jgi:replication factor C small subunit